jgi:hypothetical protein
VLISHSVAGGRQVIAIQETPDESSIYDSFHGSLVFGAGFTLI